MPILGTKQLQEIIANDDVVLAAQRRVLDSQRQQALNYDNPSLENQPYLTDPQIQFQFDRTVNQLIGYIKNGARDSVSGVNVENRNSFAAIETYPQLVAFYNSYVVPSINSNPMFRRQVYKALDEIAQVADVMVQRLSSIQPQVARQQSSAFDNTGVPTYFIDIFTKIRDDCLARNLRYVSPSGTEQTQVQLYPQPGQQGQMGMQQPPQPPQQFPPIIPSERDDRGRIPSQRYDPIYEGGPADYPRADVPPIEVYPEIPQGDPAIQQAYQNYNRGLFRGMPQEESKGPIYEAESKGPEISNREIKGRLRQLRGRERGQEPQRDPMGYDRSDFLRSISNIEERAQKAQELLINPLSIRTDKRSLYDALRKDLERLSSGTFYERLDDAVIKGEDLSKLSLEFRGLTPHQKIESLAQRIADLLPRLERIVPESQRKKPLKPIFRSEKAKRVELSLENIQERLNKLHGRGKSNKSNNVLDRILNDNKSTYNLMVKFLKKKR